MYDGKMKNEDMKMRIITAVIISVLVSLPVMAQMGKKGEEKPTPKTTIPAKKPAPSRRSTSAPRTSRTNNAKDEAAANERTFWESIRNSINPEDFRAYLNKYPNGEFAALARNKISSLEAAASPQSGTMSTVSPTPSSPALATNESEESSASLEETLNWLGARLTDATFTYSVIIEKRGVEIYDRASVNGSGNFRVDRCTLTVEYIYTPPATIYEIRGKGIIPFSDIDPLSIKRVGPYISMQTSRQSIKRIMFAAGKVESEVSTSSLAISLRGTSVDGVENGKRVEKAIRHAIKLCGGKSSPF